MLYNELTPKEQIEAKTLLLNALNAMEAEQAAGAGEEPHYYSYESELFKQTLPETEFKKEYDKLYDEYYIAL